MEKNEAEKRMEQKMRLQHACTRQRLQRVLPFLELVVPSRRVWLRCVKLSREKKKITDKAMQIAMAATLHVKSKSWQCIAVYML